jgi:hypothetical protein
MALSANTLAEELKLIFAQMRDGTKTDDWYAVELARAITAHIQTAEIPAGRVVVQVTGQAAGIPNTTGINVV